MTAAVHALLVFRLTIFMVDVRGKARYRRVSSNDFNSYKLATRTFVISVPGEVGMLYQFLRGPGRCFPGKFLKLMLLKSV